MNLYSISSRVVVERFGRGYSANNHFQFSREVSIAVELFFFWLYHIIGVHRTKGKSVF